MWLKWNQSRIDANEAALNAVDLQVTRPINDWCADGSIPEAGISRRLRTTRIGPQWAESWDDWGPFYTPMYSQLVGLNGSTVEMCSSLSLVAATTRRDDLRPVLSPNRQGRPSRLPAGAVPHDLVDPPVRHREPGRAPARSARDLRGEDDADRTEADDLRPPPGFDNAENNWMHRVPEGLRHPDRRRPAKRRRGTATRTWLLTNGIERRPARRRATSTARPASSAARTWSSWIRRFAVSPTRPSARASTSRRGSASSTHLPGPGATGYLWGADVVTIPDSGHVRPGDRAVSPHPDPSRRRRRLAECIGVRACDRLGDRSPHAERAARHGPHGRARDCTVHQCARQADAGRHGPVPGLGSGCARVGR